MKHYFFKYEHTYLFAFLLYCVVTYFDYSTVSSYSIKGNQIELQAENASIAKHYTTKELSLTNPQTHNLGEKPTFSWQNPPIVPFFAAIVYKIFGEEDGNYRWLVFFVFVLGLLALSKLIRNTTEDTLFSFGVPLLLLGSPIIAFYSFNFLTVPVAFAFSLMGWHWFIRYTQKQNISVWYIAVFCFIIGLWIDVTTILSPIIILLAFLLESVFISIFYKEKVLFKKKLHAVFGIVALLGMMLWKGLPIIQKSATLTPITAVPNQTIFDNLLLSWGFFHWGTIILLSFLLIFILVTPKKQDNFWYFSTLISSIICLGIGIFFFDAFVKTNYAIFGLLWLPISIFITIGIYLNKYKHSVLSSYRFKFFVLIALLLNIIYAKKQLPNYYETSAIPSVFYQEEFTDFMTKINIPEDAEIIYLSDSTTNAALYLLDRKGWTTLNDKADYLIFSEENLLNDEGLKPYFEDFVGFYYKTFWVYRLGE